MVVSCLLFEWSVIQIIQKLDTQCLLFELPFENLSGIQVTIKIRTVNKLLYNHQTKI